MTYVMLVEDRPVPRQMFESLVDRSTEYDLLLAVETPAEAEAHMNADVRLIVMGRSPEAEGSADRIKAAYPGVQIIMVSPRVEYIYEEYPAPGAPLRTGYRIGNADVAELTAREREVLRELLSGDGDEEIAMRLRISVWTVRHHIKSMLEKTGFRNRTQLAVRAVICGLGEGTPPREFTNISDETD